MKNPKIGDRVAGYSSGGRDTGVVVGVLQNGMVEVDFESCLGKYYAHQKQLRRLKLVSRPKKKVTKTIERYVNLYGRETTPMVCHETKELAEAASCDRYNVITVKLTGSYECEEIV